MIDLLIVLVFNSLYCFGMYNACLYVPQNQLTGESEAKGVLWFVEKWSLNKWFYKPLCGCLPCMASIHSIIPYWAFMYVGNSIDLKMLVLYPVYIVALSGLNYLIDRE